MDSLQYRRNVERFLDTLSSEALAYLFPGAEREEIEDAFGLGETGQTNYYYSYQTPDVWSRGKGGTTSFMQALTVQPRTQEPEDDYSATLEDGTIDFLPGVFPDSKSTYSHGGDVTDDSYLEMDMDERARDEAIMICMNESHMTDRDLRDAVRKLRSTLKKNNRLSRLHINSEGDFFLEGAVNAKLKLDVLSKTFYILYLHHPEGINYKDFGDYQKELEKIYSNLSHRLQMEDMMDSLKRMYGPDDEDGCKSQCSSRIKREFEKVMTPIIARDYYVYGTRGGTRRINLSRDLVIDEFSNNPHPVRRRSR